LLSHSLFIFADEINQKTSVFQIMAKIWLNDGKKYEN
jgi:hypothetical protein